MATRTVVTLENFEPIRAAIERVPEDVRDSTSDVVSKTAVGARQRTIAMAPVDTGALRRSITASSRGLSGRVETPPVYYWRFIEYGTKYIKAKPFIRPAAELEAIDVAERVRQMAARLERDFASGRLL